MHIPGRRSERTLWAARSSILPSFLDMLRTRRSVLPLCLLALVPALLFVGLCCGSVPISIGDVVTALLGGETTESTRVIVTDFRLPRLFTALLVGGGLGVCGLITQTLFENPLADPSLFGIHAGAAVGAAVGPLLWSLIVAMGQTSFPPFVGQWFSVLTALCGALGVLAVIVLLARSACRGMSLLVAGVMVSFLLSSVLALIAYYSTADGLRSFQLWTMGDFSTVGRARLPLFALALVLPLGYCLRRHAVLDAWLLGEDYAVTLGVSPRKSRSHLLFAVGWISACTTAFCGPIAFIGLAAPHLARLLCGTSLHRYILPTTLGVGAVLTLSCQLLCSLPFTGGNLPLNAVTPLIGAPIVLWLLTRQSTP